MSLKKGIAFSAMLLLLLAAGCSGGDSGSSGRPTTATPAPSPATGDAASGGDLMGTASVKGSVQFEGEAPGGKKIRMDADPFCTKQHPDGATTEEVVVNENGTLRNVFVYVKAGLEGRAYPVPTEPVTLDQNGCRYKPHIQGMMAGQAIKILNSDDTLHNIHAQPANNKAFNIAMPKYLKERDEAFDTPEVMVPIRCDVHSWMATYVGVVAHPFYSVSGADGTFDLSELPAGTYTIEAWHEKYGTQTEEVTVGDGESQEISFSFSAS